MENKELFAAQELNENDLEKVQGGAVDWIAFSDKFLSALSSSDVVVTKEYKDLAEAIKTKDWISVQIIAIPLIAKDPLIAKIFNECM